MMRNLKFLAATALVFLTHAAAATATHPSMSDILAAAPASAWRPVDVANTLYMDLPAGRVVIEMAPRFAPRHVENIKSLARSHYFDGLGVLRVQDNYVAQWGGADARHPIPAGMLKVAPEFDSPLPAQLPFTRLPDGDVYAPEVGWSDGFPVARSAKLGRVWLAHCYGMVGVGRDLDAQSGSGAELYAVIGHAPRHLDRNVALVGRVLQGMELLSSLPRGTAEMGFYGAGQAPTPIAAVRVAADLPEAERTPLEVLRTDTPTFAALIESRRNRPEEFFKTMAEHIEVCNVPLPVRAAPHVP